MRRQQDSYRAGHVYKKHLKLTGEKVESIWAWARGGAKNFNDGQTGGHIIPTFMRNQVHRDRINLVGMIKRRR